LHHFIWRTFGLSPRRVLQRGNGFDSEALARAGTYLEGYWQSERYFQDIEPTIREELQFANAPDPENAALLDDIAGRPAISLHVRRGDYLLPKHQLMYAGCSLEYYRNAVDFIAASANIDPVVYVFSDDTEWARDSLQLKAHTRIVSHNGVERAHEDLRLMSACRHHIIANSTFSWWGAWLNASPDKIVVAPKTWTLDPAIYNPDILPASWRAMENTKPQAAGVS
jgi:hypothetical protein